VVDITDGTVETTGEAELQMRTEISNIIVTTLLVIAPGLMSAASPPALLFADTSGTSRSEAQISAAEGGAGNWGVLWTSNAPVGIDVGILFQRSTNDGVTWSAPLDVSLAGVNPTDTGTNPMLATDGGNTWVAAWDATEDAGSGMQTLRKIFVTRSADGGANWATPVAVSEELPFNTRSNYEPCIGTDGAGVWVVVWEGRGTGPLINERDSDLIFARSTDNGATWSAPAVLNSNAATDTKQDQRPRLATDKAGKWMVAWMAYGTNEMTVPYSPASDIYVARSADNGATWQAPMLVSTTGVPTDRTFDNYPAIVFAGSAKWAVAWDSTETTPPLVQPGSRVWASRSTDDGDTFSAPVCVQPGTDYIAATHVQATVAGSSLVLTWDEAAASDPQPRLKGSFSYDAGATWTAPGLLTSDPAGGGTRPVPAGAAASGRTLVAWPTGSDSRAGDYYHMFLDATTAGINDWMLW
jgi:hypothetical protein